MQFECLFTKYLFLFDGSESNVEISNYIYITQCIFFKYVNKTLLNHWKNPKRGQILVDWISKLKCEIMRE